MVRVNIIEPEKLLDQHLLAEWNEIQMLLGTIVKYPKINWVKMPFKYKLGPGHIMFFKDKVNYLFKRLTALRVELIERGYNVVSIQSIGDKYLPHLEGRLMRDWQPSSGDFEIIKARLMEKFLMKPGWYTYRGRHITIQDYEFILK